MTKLEEKIKEVLIDVLCLEDEEVMSMREDKESLSIFEPDELDCCEIEIELEKAFNVPIERECITEDSKFKDLVNLIKLAKNEE